MAEISAEEKKIPLIILTGPTAVGKTKLSIELAKEFDCEIISADSMQVYKKMDIGTAKITEEEMCGVRHHLIDILEPTEDFNVFSFKEYADKAIRDIYERGHIPMIVGGTGFYIQAVLYDIEFEKESDEQSSSIRTELENLCAQKGAAYLHRMLEEVDPEAADEIHENNTKRVIRAIEFYKLTGTKISSHNKTQRQKESPYNFVYFVLNDDREKLYERIDKRIDIMFDKGLVNEVKSLIELGLTKEHTAMQGIGYKEIFDFLMGETSLEQTRYILKRDTRHFAKRQLTWFRREKDVCFVNLNELGGEKEALKFMREKITERDIENYEQLK